LLALYNKPSKPGDSEDHDYQTDIEKNSSTSKSQSQSKNQTRYTDNYTKIQEETRIPLSKKPKVEQDSESLRKAEAEKIKELEVIAQDFYKKKNYIKAMESYMDSQSKIKEKFGLRSLEYAMNLHSVGNCYLKLGDYSRAIENFRAADEILVKNFYTTSNFFAKNLSYLSFAYLKENNFKTAFDLANKAKELYERNRISNDEELAMIFSVIGYYYFSIKDDEKSRDILEKAESHIKKTEENYSEMHMNNLYYLGQIYLKKGLYSEALNKFTESHSISEEIKFLEVEYHVFCLENIITLFEKIGKKDLASKYAQKLKVYKL